MLFLLSSISVSILNEQGEAHLLDTAVTVINTAVAEKDTLSSIQIFF